MEWIVGITILVVASILYIVANKNAFCSTYIECVEAGASDSVDADTLKRLSFRDKRRWILNKRGWPVSMHDKLRVIVHGNCMSKRGIHDRDQLVVQKVNNNDLGKLKKGDIVMIHLKDKGIDKIREFDKFTEDGRLDTLYYNEDGSVRHSSHAHTRESIVGRVRYRL